MKSTFKTVQKLPDSKFEQIKACRQQDIENTPVQLNNQVPENQRQFGTQTQKQKSFDNRTPGRSTPRVAGVLRPRVSSAVLADRAVAGSGEAMLGKITGGGTVPAGSATGSLTPLNPIRTPRIKREDNATPTCSTFRKTPSFHGQYHIGVSGGRSTKSCSSFSPKFQQRKLELVRWKLRKQKQSSESSSVQMKTPCTGRGVTPRDSSAQRILEQRRKGMMAPTVAVYLSEFQDHLEKELVREDTRKKDQEELLYGLFDPIPNKNLCIDDNTRRRKLGNGSEQSRKSVRTLSLPQQIDIAEKISKMPIFAESAEKLKEKIVDDTLINVFDRPLLNGVKPTKLQQEFEKQINADKNSSFNKQAILKGIKPTQLQQQFEKHIDADKNSSLNKQNHSSEQKESPITDSSSQKAGNIEDFLMSAFDSPISQNGAECPATNVDNKSSSETLEPPPISSQGEDIDVFLTNAFEYGSPNKVDMAKAVSNTTDKHSDIDTSLMSQLDVKMKPSPTFHKGIRKEHKPPEKQQPSHKLSCFQVIIIILLSLLLGVFSGAAVLYLVYLQIFGWELNHRHPYLQESRTNLLEQIKGGMMQTLNSFTDCSDMCLAERTNTPYASKFVSFVITSLRSMDFGTFCCAIMLCLLGLIMLASLLNFVHKYLQKKRNNMPAKLHTHPDSRQLPCQSHDHGKAKQEKKRPDNELSFKDWFILSFLCVVLGTTCAAVTLCIMCLPSLEWKLAHLPGFLKHLLSKE